MSAPRPLGLPPVLLLERLPNYLEAPLCDDCWTHDDREGDGRWQLWFRPFTHSAHYCTKHAKHALGVATAAELKALSTPRPLDRAGEETGSE